MVVLGCSIALVISYELVYGDAGKCLPWRRQVDELRADAEEQEQEVVKASRLARFGVILDQLQSSTSLAKASGPSTLKKMGMLFRNKRRAQEAPVAQHVPEG
mmetsp:Transcript_9373/g.16391  ORF Transcript_9373/g.16391 Transcript_9373/m.16391 type:complete len:102 (+) Transcript_9373:61-366(+)